MKSIREWVLRGEVMFGIGAAWNEAPRFKQVLDLGAAGVMVPYVNTAEEARRAAEAMRFRRKGFAASPNSLGLQGLARILPRILLMPMSKS
jgi:hypothetical protein